MRLNTMTSSIIHQMLNPDINVIYYPTLGLFDHLLYLTDNNFFVFSNNLKSCAANCRCIDSDFVDIFDYDLAIANSVTQYGKQCSGLSQTFHVNPIIFEHNLPDASLKKEDKFILNSQLKRVKKIFFDQDIQKVWGFEDSSCNNYGIPIDKFTPIADRKTTKKVLISSSGQSNGHVIANQLKQHIDNNLKMECDIVTNLAESSIENINLLFSQYEIYIDLNNNPVDCLCASSAGLQTIGLSNLKNIDHVPNINQVNSVQDIIDLIPNVTNQNIDMKAIHEYIDGKFNFTQFKNTVNNIFKQAKREAQVL